MGILGVDDRTLPPTTVLGTPYSTSFNESDNKHYYAVIGEDLKINLKEIDFGLRHLVLPYSGLKANADFINDPNYDTLLKVYINDILDKSSIDLREEILKNYNVRFVDIKYIPLSETGKEAQSKFVYTKEMFDLTDDLIDQYCEENCTYIPKHILLDGVDKLKHEYKKNQNN